MASEVDLGKREGSDLAEVDLGRIKVGSAVDLGRNDCEESAGVLCIVDLTVGKLGSENDIEVDVLDSGKEKGGCDVLRYMSSLVGVPLAAVFTVATELLGNTTAKWDDNMGRSVSDAITVLL